MKNDAFLFLGIILFLFVLWVYSGGPMHPISFSGPYITPVTNVDTVQVGYGDSANDFNTHGSFWGRFSGGGGSDVIESAQSPYVGKVFISSSYPGASSARDENITIRSDDVDDVTVTGWRLIAAKEGTQVTIPDGSEGDSNRKKSIRLEPGETLIITTGTRSNSDQYYRYDNTWYAYLGKRSDIWRDKNDTITLLDADGKVVDQYSY